MFSNHAYNKNLSRGKRYTIFTSVTKQTRNQILEAYYWSEGKKYIFELLMNISLSSFADCRRSLTFHRHFIGSMSVSYELQNFIWPA